MTASTSADKHPVLEWKNTGLPDNPAWECDLRIDDVLTVGALASLEHGAWIVMLNVAVDNHTEPPPLPARWNYDLPDLPLPYATAEAAREEARRRLIQIHDAFRGVSHG